jgi:hypothetical protein
LLGRERSNGPAVLGNALVQCCAGQDYGTAVQGLVYAMQSMIVRHDNPSLAWQWFITAVAGLRPRSINKRPPRERSVGELPHSQGTEPSSPWAEY